MNLLNDFEWKCALESESKPEWKETIYIIKICPIK